jgi:hypothetical protein
MGNGFDDFSKRFGRTTTRRQALGLFGRTAAVAVAGTGAIQLIGGGSVAFAECKVEYPPANLADCPNKRPHPGNMRASNGCGPASGGSRPPQSFGSASFTSACNNHDICYETCNTPKANCDIAFGHDLVDTCKAAYAGSPLRLAACATTAIVYQGAVTYWGADAYEAGQKKDCECCRPVPMVYCGCNHTCYTSASQCTTECHASLGCFTQICGPATPEQCP